MNKKEVIIIGSAGHAKVIIDIFEKSNYNILGLLDTFREDGEETMGYKIIGKDVDLPSLSEQHPNCEYFIAIGDNWLRHTVRNKIIKILPNAKFANAIHPNAAIARTVVLGSGIAIMAGCIVNSNTVIEDFSILNTGASIDHDSKMSSFSSLAPRAATGGKVTIGEFSAVCMGATIKHRVTIGKHTIVGAASLLLTNTGDYEVLYGVPAKKIRDRKPGDKYL